MKTKKTKIIKKENKNKIIKYLRSLIFRSLSVIIIFLIMAIISRTSPTYKDLIISNIYEKNISFAKIKNHYNKYLGGINPLEKVSLTDEMVFNEELTYTESSIYHDGVKLTVTNNYLIPVEKEGMVVYIGEKENYGNVIIIEGLDGIDIWYGNIDKTSVKLYDYVSAGAYLGTTRGNTLYLVYQQDGKYLDYQEFLK